MPPLSAPVGRRRPVRGTVLLLTALTTAGLCPSPALGASSPPPGGTSTPAGTTAPAAGTAEDAPIVATQADLDAQQQRLEALQSQAAREGDALAAAQVELQLAAARAGATLERYAESTRTMVTAQAEEEAQEQHLEQSRLEVAEQRRRLARWAREAYVQGPLNSHPALVTVLSAEPGDDLAGSLQVLRQVGRSQRRMVRAAEQAGIDQVAAVTAASAASQRAEEAAVEAATAKSEAATAVAEQRTLVVQLQDSVTSTRVEAGQARQRAGALRDVLARRAAQEAAAAAAAAAAGTGQSNAASTGNRVTGPVGACTGGDPSGYPNGQIPADVLCPLASAPAHRLRADAAYAYDQLADAYAAQFGTSLCITDSYRSLAVQERTYVAKPGLAAVPGTSNHGWGTAVDLCGGIQDFGSEQHAWMLTHAPLFNWFHPAWAEPGGSRPEPWHWEYGG